MSFVESPRFPEAIAYGATGGPEYKTDVVILDSGAEQRNARWAQARLRYTVDMPLMPDKRGELVAFFRAMKGRAHGFRLKDWLDYQVDITNGRLGTSTVGTGYAAYQLYKYYERGLNEYRSIRKPVVGTVQIYRGGALQTAGAGAGNYALDTTTGVVTFVADISRNITNVSIASSAVVTMATAMTGLTSGKSFYISGVNGTVGTVLNGLVHTVTGVSGSQYTISTNTTGLAYTSGGLAALYPQTTEVLTWSGEFDVPVRFDSDYLSLTMETHTVSRMDAIQLIEIRQ
jgi:uncharacterized protein (TIGR02217 family)